MERTKEGMRALRNDISEVLLGSDNKPVAEFGNRHIVYVPRNVITILPQIRREFDGEKLQELAESMPLADDADGLVHELMEPVIEGVHTSESARAYLDQYNRANPENDHAYSIDDLTPWETSEGLRYVIHIAGERRIRAVDILIKKHGYSAESLLRSSVHENISYVDALPLQFIENNARVNPSKADEARAMRGYIDFMREIDPTYTQKKCAEKFAVSPDRVHDALVFTNYPPSMQALEKHYPFSWLIDAEKIYDAWREYYVENASGVIDPLKMGLLGSDDEPVSVDERDDTGAWTTSDGRTFFESPEDAAAHEVELCFMKIKAEQLARRAALRKKDVRAAEDVRFSAQLAKIKRLIVDEAEGRGQDVMLGIDGEEADCERPPHLWETYGKRRAAVSATVFEAALQALLLLDRRGDLSGEMRTRLAQCALVDTVADSEEPDIYEIDELFPEDDEARR